MATMIAAMFTDRDLARLREEFVSLPGMCLDLPQVARLVDVDKVCAAHLLEELEAEGLLVRSTRPIYRRASLPCNDNTRFAGPNEVQRPACAAGASLSPFSTY
ncbi:MAG: hypothetical protein ACRD2I_05195 [Vicinamibacterales bacterium]